jgi:hypothetical protein
MQVNTATLKKRGSGFSFEIGSKLARNFIVGESESPARHKIKVLCSSQWHLTKDGV